MLIRTYKAVPGRMPYINILNAVQAARREFGPQVRIDWDDERSRVDFDRREVTLVVAP